jgi:hypothetical protein
MLGNDLNSTQQRHSTVIYSPSKRYNATNSNNDRARSGHPRVIAPRQDKYILGEPMNNRLTRDKQVTQLPIGNHQRLISDDTVRRRLIANNIRYCRQAKGPLLTIRHRQERLQSTMQHQNWRHRRWRNIIFSDESRYSIFNADGRPRVCRKRGKRLSVACSMERDSWGRPNIRAWCGNGLYFKLGNVIFQNIGTCRLRSLAT